MRSLRSLQVVIVTLGLGALAASAQTTYWLPTSGTSFWTNSANWSGGVPGLANVAAITNAGTYTVVFDAPSPTSIGGLVLTNGTSTLLITNGSSLAVTNGMDMRGTGTSKISVTPGGAFVFSNWYVGGAFSLAVNGGTVTNVASTTLNSFGLQLVNGGANVVISNGGTFFSYGSVGFGSSGQYLIADRGSLIVTNNFVSLFGSTASLTISNGNLTLLPGTSSDLRVGSFNSAVGGKIETLLLAGSSGSVTNFGKLSVGQRAQGTMTGVSTGVVQQVDGNFWQGGAVSLGMTNLVGLINVLGGTFTATNAIYGGVEGTGIGRIAVSNATFRADGGLVWLGTSALSLASLDVRAGGSFLATNLVLGSLAGAGGTGTVNVAAGSLAVTNASGGGLLNVRLGSLTLDGGSTLVDRLVATNAAGTLGLNSGSLSLGSGTLISNGTSFAVGNGVGAATLRLNNGAHSFRDGLSVSAKSTLQVTNSTTTISAPTVTNLGTVSVMHGQAIFNGNVVNQGAWVSDPSTNTFNGNYTVGPTGYVSAASNDVYAFGGDFIMASTNTAFNMSQAHAVFATNGYGLATTTRSHTLNLTNSGAVDLGSNWINHLQLQTNFAIGTMTIALSNQVTIAGVKSGATTNALYVGVLDLTAWNTNAAALTSTLQAALYLPDINVYYDKYAAENAYLQGLEFNVWSGGLLIPIPEPSAAMMLAGALGIGLVVWGRRRG